MARATIRVTIQATKNHIVATISRRRTSRDTMYKWVRAARQQDRVEPPIRLEAISHGHTAGEQEPLADTGRSDSRSRATCNENPHFGVAQIAVARVMTLLALRILPSKVHNLVGHASTGPLKPTPRDHGPGHNKRDPEKEGRISYWNGLDGLLTYIADHSLTRVASRAARATTSIWSQATFLRTGWC